MSGNPGIHPRSLPGFDGRGQAETRPKVPSVDSGRDSGFSRQGSSRLTGKTPCRALCALRRKETPDDAGVPVSRLRISITDLDNPPIAA